jgi:hypothetical protein
MRGQNLLLSIFILNWLLIIGDAALGYFVMPLLLRAKADDLTDDGMASVMIRRLLTATVVFYMLVNCYAYFRQYPTLLFVVTAFVVLDIIVQFVVRQRKTRQS